MTGSGRGVNLMNRPVFGPTGSMFCTMQAAANQQAAQGGFMHAGGAFRSGVNEINEANIPTESDIIYASFENQTAFRSLPVTCPPGQLSCAGTGECIDKVFLLLCVLVGLLGYFYFSTKAVKIS